MFVSSPESKQDDILVNLVGAQPGGCPVCKHPTGDCKGDSEYHGRVTFVPQSLNNPLATFRVQKRIYQEEQVGSKTVRTLLYPVGASITIEEAKRLGLVRK